VLSPVCALPTFCELCKAAAFNTPTVQPYVLADVLALNPLALLMLVVRVTCHVFATAAVLAHLLDTVFPVSCLTSAIALEVALPSDNESVEILHPVESDPDVIQTDVAASASVLFPIVV